MKKTVLIIALMTSTAASAALVDVHLAAIDKAFSAATSANPALAGRIGESQIAWAKWAELDCKARIGEPAEATITVKNARFDACMAEQMARRADQLNKYACSSNSKFCQTR